jgi:hypothetical protein
MVKNQVESFFWRTITVYGSPYDEAKSEFIDELDLGGVCLGFQAASRPLALRISFSGPESQWKLTLHVKLGIAKRTASASFGPILPTLLPPKCQNAMFYVSLLPTIKAILCPLFSS